MQMQPSSQADTPKTSAPADQASGPRVVMLTSQFLPEVFGGAEQQCLRLSRALAERGVQVRILTSRSDPSTPAEEVLDGIPVTRLLTRHPPQQGGKMIGSTVAWMKALRGWFDAHRDEVDIIHCHQAKVNSWAGVRNAKRLGVPAIVKPGSAGPNFDLLSLRGKKLFWGRYAAAQVARDIDRIIGISEEMMQDITNWGVPESRRIFIPNGVAPQPAAPGAREELRSTLGISPDTRLMIFVGRMETQKNVATLLKALARQTEAARPWHLVLLGDGVLLETHKAEAEALGIADRCRFEGRSNRVADWLAAADMMVLPALAEGMSNAILEAMSAGIPQLASRVSGNTDLVRDGATGWLYSPPRDVDALAQVLETALAATPEVLQAMGKAAQEDVARTFAIGVVADRYRDLYRTLLDEKARAA